VSTGAPSAGRRTLERARFFLERAEESDANTERAALENFIAATVVFGRSVTFHLQADYNHHDGFDEWWAERREEMRADPEMKALVELRNIELKVGPAGVRRVVNLELTSTAMAISDVLVSGVTRAAPMRQRPLKSLLEDARRFVLDPLAKARRLIAVARHQRRSSAATTTGDARITDDKLFFSDPAFASRHAFDVLRDYLGKLGTIVAATEEKFGTTGG
jgi:hypothetical protein